MDFSVIVSAVSALNSAKELGRAALAIRDFNQFAGAISQINDQLLKAQESLFTHNSQLLDMQQKHLEAREELRNLKETLAERGRYSLVELTKGSFVYRLNVAPSESGTIDPVRPEPVHHLCQPCFDQGVKIVLQRTEFYSIVSLRCSRCSEKFATGERV